MLRVADAEGFGALLQHKLLDDVLDRLPQPCLDSPSRNAGDEVSGGNHLSNTTRLTQVFLKSGE